jgi:TolB protein
MVRGRDLFFTFFQTAMPTPYRASRRLALIAAIALAVACASAPRPAEPCAVRFTGAAELVGRDTLSTPFTDVRLTISADGGRELWGTNARTGGPGSYDIWERRRIGATWSAPRPVSFDTEHKEFDPFLAPDGSGVYYFSNRPGGMGGDDLYFSALNAKGEFEPGVNLGRGVNSAGDEWGPSVSPDGSRLLFASDGFGGRGKHDLLVATRRADGSWGTAEPIAGEINGPLDEFDASYLDDGRTIAFAREEIVGADTSSALMASFFARGGYSRPVKLSSAVNLDGVWDFGTATSGAAPGVLFFTSHRADSVGRSDLYRIGYQLRSTSCELPAGS